MASNFNNDNSNWRTLIEYILTSDTVLGDPANLVQGSSFSGKINQVLQKMIDNLNWLRAKLPGNASTTTLGLIQILDANSALALTDTNKALTAAVLKDILQNSSVARSIIRGLVPVNKYYSGRGVTAESGSQTFLLPNVIPTNETFMGGIAFANKGTDDPLIAFDLKFRSNGRRVYIDRDSRSAGTGASFNPAQAVWQYWTREN